MATVMLAVDRLLVLPFASWMATLMPPAGLLPIVLLTVEVIGCAVNASCVGAPTTVNCVETLKLLLFSCVATTVCSPAVLDGTVKMQVPVILPPLFCAQVATCVPVLVFRVPSQ